MKRHRSAAVIPLPENPSFKSAQINQQEITYNKKSKQQSFDEIEIKSNLSNSKKLKMPESMKNFLKDRKLLRQLNKDKSQKSFKDNLETQKPKVLNQTNLQIYDMQSENPQNQINNDIIILQQPSVTSEIPNKNTRNSKNVIQKQFTIKNNPKNIICSICQGQITQKNQVKAFTCRHIYCDQCIKSYIKYKISIFQEVHCPQQSCNGVLDTQHSVYRNFSKRQRRFYKKIHNFYTTQNAQTKKLCPKQQCDGIIDLLQNTPTQQCNTCKVIFCSKCFLERHQGPCRDYQIKFIQDTLHYRQCTKCKIVVQKIEGCNHITCKCGNQFCYICGGNWKHDHICRPTDQDLDSGCDWGQNWQDHFCFLIKLPLKFILITVYTCFWIVVSFSAAPYNIFFFIYWLLLIFIGGPVVYIFQEQDRNGWQILFLILIFPILMIYCIPQGVQLFLERFEQQCPWIQMYDKVMIKIKRLEKVAKTFQRIKDQYKNNQQWLKFKKSQNDFPIFYFSIGEQNQLKLKLK